MLLPFVLLDGSVTTANISSKTFFHTEYSIQIDWIFNIMKDFGAAGHFPFQIRPILGNDWQPVNNERGPLCLILCVCASVKKLPLIVSYVVCFFLWFLDLPAEQVTAYLLDNPDFLERHIMKEIELEQLERWMIRRTQQAKKATSSVCRNGRKTSLSRYKRKNTNEQSLLIFFYYSTTQYIFTTPNLTLKHIRIFMRPQKAHTNTRIDIDLKDIQNINTFPFKFLLENPRKFFIIFYSNHFISFHIICVYHFEFLLLLLCLLPYSSSSSVFSLRIHSFYQYWRPIKVWPKMQFENSLKSMMLKMSQFHRFIWFMHHAHSNVVHISPTNHHRASHVSGSIFNSFPSNRFHFIAVTAVS